MRGRWQRLIRQPILLIILAVHVLSVSTLVYAQQAPTRSDQPVTLPEESAFSIPTVAGVPQSIRIPDLGVSLEIIPGGYDATSDTWTLSGRNAHFATITRPANNASGNTFIYGHNNKHVFGPLKRIAPGTQVEILTNNGNRFYYSYVGSKTVPPSDVSIFTYTGKPILTIQTCTGAWHEQRQLYSFSLDRVVESPTSMAQRDEEKRQATLAVVRKVLSPTAITLDDSQPKSEEAIISPDSEISPSLKPPAHKSPQTIQSMLKLSELPQSIYQKF